jgi:peptide deformylase
VPPSTLSPMRHGTIPGSSGSVRTMRLLSDPLLHAACRPVTSFDDELAWLVEGLYATM